MTKLYGKKIGLALLISGTMFFASCGDVDKKEEDPKKVAEEHNEHKFNNEKEKTAAFMVFAADLNLGEIQLAELAQGNAYNEEIKKHARMMVADHTKALNELKSLAASKSVSLPESASDEKKNKCDKLGKKTRHDFDEEYCDMMVDGHKEAIEKFEKEVEEGTDEEVRNWAKSMLPVLRTHMDHSLECQKLADSKENKKDTAVVVKNREVKEYKNKEDGSTSAPAKSSTKKDW